MTLMLNHFVPPPRSVHVGATRLPQDGKMVDIKGAVPPVDLYRATDPEIAAAADWVDLLQASWHLAVESIVHHLGKRIDPTVRFSPFLFRSTSVEPGTRLEVRGLTHPDAESEGYDDLIDIGSFGEWKTERYGARPAGTTYVPSSNGEGYFFGSALSAVGPRPSLLESYEAGMPHSIKTRDRDQYTAVPTIFTVGHDVYAAWPVPLREHVRREMPLLSYPDLERWERVDVDAVKVPTDFRHVL